MNQKPGKEELDNWRKDPDNWKWGVFYFNPRDRRIFPPKRVAAMGWTVNFANPLSILALVLVVVGVVCLSRYLTRVG